MFQFRHALEKYISLVCFADTEQGMLGMLVWLVLEKGFAPYVGLMPKSAYFSNPANTQKPSDLHL